jgi:hypothetical protein
MSNKASMCVVIPVHKPQPSADELISLHACKRHLFSYDCYLVYPDGMDVSIYTIAYPGLKLQPVSPAWLASVEAYNKMKLSLAFYMLFNAYDFMLTYELDAYIFNADLEEANAFKFDYIGAPFFDGYWAAVPGAPFIKGGNSGFSVRNIQSCIRVLRSMKKYRLKWMLYSIFLSHLPALRLKLNKITNYRYDVFISGKFGFYFARFHLNEDVVWSEIVPQLFPKFTIADPLSALIFSFEYNLEDSLKLNNGNLPLGCHAWFKHLDFWRRYIDTENVN